MAKPIITTARPHGHSVGERATMSYFVPDTRWWRVLWFKLTFRKRPMREMAYKVTALSETTFQVD